MQKTAQLACVRMKLAGLAARPTSLPPHDPRRNEIDIDLVFSDVIMPGMNGVELATVLRERYLSLPVVLTSGYSSYSGVRQRTWII